jgi:hypothetical protein
MSIHYWPPLEEAVERTRSYLFRPFDLGRWLTLAFTAWLVYLGQSGGSAAGSDPEVQTQVREADFSGAVDRMVDSVGGIVPAGVSVLLLMSLATVILLVMVALLWVSCRARFVWLENLTSGDPSIGAHWRRFGRLGDSFFFWKIGFFFVTIALVMPLVFFTGLFAALAGHGFAGPGSVLGWILLGAAIFAVVALLALVDFYAESFVTVIMHRHQVGVLAAWQRFRVLFDAQPGHFVLVAVVKILLHMLGGLVLGVVGLLTCCVGFVLMALPYIGAVVKLPVLMGLRYYDLCWLGQCDPDLRLPARATPPPAPAEPLAPSPASPTPDNDPNP